MIKDLRNTLLLLAFCFAATINSYAQTELTLADKIINTANACVGSPYLLGATGAKSFDNTGFTQYVFSQNGLKLGRGLKAQLKAGVAVDADIDDMSELRKGDLVFFGDELRPDHPVHVGIFLCLNADKISFQFIHAENSKEGVIVSYSDDDLYDGKFLCARRLFITRTTPRRVPAPSEVASTTTKPATTTTKPAATTTTKPATTTTKPAATTTTKPSTTTKPATTTTKPVETATPSQVITLGNSDKKIVLHKDGTWGYMGADGKLVAPKPGEKIVMAADGSWAVFTTSDVMLPDIKVAEATAAAKGIDTYRPNGGPARTTNPASSAQYHTVKAGDTLSGIASKYRTTVAKLCSLNGIKATTTLQIGRKLRVK